MLFRKQIEVMRWKLTGGRLEVACHRRLLRGLNDRSHMWGPGQRMCYQKKAKGMAGAEVLEGETDLKNRKKGSGERGRSPRRGWRGGQRPDRKGSLGTWKVWSFCDGKYGKFFGPHKPENWKTSSLTWVKTEDERLKMGFEITQGPLALVRSSDLTQGLTQWFLVLTVHWNHPGSFKQTLMSGPTPTNSDIICLECSLGMWGFFKAPPWFWWRAKVDHWNEKSLEEGFKQESDMIWILPRRDHAGCHINR